MNREQELQILDSLLDFQIPTIPADTRFWMIRTQKGYFYDEFIAKNFVAIAWNTITKDTDFSEQGKEQLEDTIFLQYPEINRPSFVINKCINFIHEIKENDILVIPSKGSKYITFALAKEYFEDTTKSVELEHTVIKKIQQGDVNISDVSCPYRKRRRIEVLRTVPSERLDYSLYRAISNYHGISNFDAYAHQILCTLYNYYIFNDSAVLVYNICKQDSIKPRELSALLYSCATCLSFIVDERHISAKMSLHSPGDSIYIIDNIKNIVTWAKDNWTIIFGFLVVFGGGTAFSFHVPGVIEIVKNILSAKSEIKSKECDAQSKKLDNDIKELELLSKRLELYEKIEKMNISPESLSDSLKMLHTSAVSLKSEPIILRTPSTQIPEDETLEIADSDVYPE